MRGARARLADAGHDEVVCRLCGRGFRAIGYWHLRRKHGFRGDHPVEDYKRRFGLRVATCRETCRLQSRQRIAWAVRTGRHRTKDQIVAELRRRVRAGEGVTPRRLGVALKEALRRRFGSWDLAMRRAGFDADAYRTAHRWDAARLARAIRERRAARESLAARDVEQQRYALFRAAVRLHGNWGAALRACGLDPLQHRVPPKWSLARAREWVRERRAAGLPVTAASAPSGLRGRVARETGAGWVAFVESMGIPYPGPKKRRWTDADVVAEIRKLRRAAHPLNLEAVKKLRGQALYHQARARFGSWDDALRAAGLDPSQTRRRTVWTRAMVLDAIRARVAARRTLHRPRVREQDRRLLQAAEARFPGGWPEAVAGAAESRPRRR